jgi:hypothetical protein
MKESWATTVAPGLGVERIAVAHWKGIPVSHSVPAPQAPQQVSKRRASVPRLVPSMVGGLCYVEKRVMPERKEPPQTGKKL